MSLLGRVSYYGGWYDYDSGYAQAFAPPGGLEQGFFRGRPVVDLELRFDVGRGTTLAVGGQNAFDTCSEVSARAMSGGREVQRVHPLGATATATTTCGSATTGEADPDVRSPPARPARSQGQSSPW